MPFSLNSSVCASSWNMGSFSYAPPNSKISTERCLSSDGYMTTNAHIKAPEISPPVSRLHPKIRMNAQDYAMYKELMENIGYMPKKFPLKSSMVLHKQA